MTIDLWTERVGELLEREYAVTPDDAGLDQDELGRHYTLDGDPVEFVRWFAMKHDLTSKSELSISL